MVGCRGEVNRWYRFCEKGPYASVHHSTRNRNVTLRDMYGYRSALKLHDRYSDSQCVRSNV